MLSRLATALLLVAVAFVGSAQANKKDPTYILPWTVCCKVVDGVSVKQVQVLSVRVVQCPNIPGGTIENPLIRLPMQATTIDAIKGNSGKYAYLDGVLQSMIAAWGQIADIQSVDEIKSNTGLITKKICEKSSGWGAKKDPKCFKVSLVRVKCQPAEELCKILKDKAVISGLKQSLNLVCEWVSVDDLLGECGEEDTLKAEHLQAIKAQVMDNETQLPLEHTFTDLTCIPFISEVLRKLQDVHHDGKDCNKVDMICDFKNDEDKADFIVELLDFLKKVKVQELKFESTISTCKEGNVRMKFDGKVCLCRELILCCKKWKLAWVTAEDKEMFDKIINCISGCNAKCTETQNIRNALKNGTLLIEFPGTTNGEAPTDDLNPQGEDVVITATCGDDVLEANFTLTCVECLKPKK